MDLNKESEFYVNKMKCSFCKDNLLYIDKVKCNTGQQMILYKCNFVISNIKNLHYVEMR